MKSAVLSLLAIAASQVFSHATFQQIWIDGVDFGGQCARLPLSNSPVQDVTSNDVRCNANGGPVARKCVIKAGSTVVVEMHQVRRPPAVIQSPEPLESNRTTCIN
ncbi:endoglucanase B [Colletotrichum higginsianum]|uniref:lytic cellulose monooxygenase (C4-dehydrogenating) n=1 Tax=Colletotrichum higginsianum (strain IMI 349063) TaxID=759273 RepID=H1VTK6_COLHI|nr:endoglucanase B [Colletotrichum higginsianum]